MELDDATKNLAEAKLVLDPEVRKKMKAESHLGELTDLVVLNQGAEKVERWLPVLKSYHPMNNTFDGLSKMFETEIAKFSPKPEIPKEEIKEPIVEEETEKTVEKTEEEESETVEPAKTEPKKPRKRANKNPYLRGGN